MSVGETDCFLHDWHHPGACPQCEATRMTAAMIPDAKGVVIACAIMFILVLALALYAA